MDFTIELTTPGLPGEGPDEGGGGASRWRALPGVTAARAQMTANVRARGGFGRQAVPGIRNIIAVGAGKGGVGKSTTAVNLAVALQRKGARVGLMDADVYGPNIPQMLGIDRAARGRATTKRMIPPEAHGIKVISMGMLVPPDQPVIWRGPMLHGAVQQFMRDVEWGELDYLVVDLPPGHRRRLAEHGPERARGRRGGGHHPAGRVRLRRAQGGRHVPPAQHPGAGRGREHELLRLRPLRGAHRDLRPRRRRAAWPRTWASRSWARSPSTPACAPGGDEGQPIVALAPDSPAAQAFVEVAGKVAAQISIQAMRVLRVIQTA